jgi:hypothetical protein
MQKLFSLIYDELFYKARNLTKQIKKFRSLKLAYEVGGAMKAPLRAIPDRQQIRSIR